MAILDIDRKFGFKYIYHYNGNYQFDWCHRCKTRRVNGCLGAFNTTIINPLNQSDTLQMGTPIGSRDKWKKKKKTWVYVCILCCWLATSNWLKHLVSRFWLPPTGLLMLDLPYPSPLTTPSSTHLNLAVCCFSVKRCSMCPHVCQVQSFSWWIYFVSFLALPQRSTNFDHCSISKLEV